MKLSITVISLVFFVLVFWLQETIAAEHLNLGDEYDVQDNILIKTRDGAEISVISVRKKSHLLPLPTILQFTIYVRDQKNGRDLLSLKDAADHGYVGIMAYTRGKRFSSNKVMPYEHDGEDAYDVIGWIEKQSWSNGKVGMYGGSYNGFTQWAAVKNLHPALKTIVPYVASRPGMGLPMDNNIFINPNYEWAFYVTNNKKLDNKVGADRARFRTMQNTWWETGQAYNELDKIDGQDNPHFQRWLKHPSYDEYWQNMVPYGQEFSQITIPILSVDGYYNDSQVSGLYYLREHLKYLPNAEHYLIIGPYGHYGAQRGGEAHLQGLDVDPIALINLKKITFQWFDYVLKNGKKPSILKDKINYQTIGTGAWQSVSSLDKMSNKILKFYFSMQEKTDDGAYLLSSVMAKKPRFLAQTVDFKDRNISNNDYYPDPIIRAEIDRSNGFVFMTKPLENDMTYSGSFEGKFFIEINKKDVDVGISLYELLPTGEYFQLSYHIVRASYAKDTTQRQLLQPHKLETVPFSRTRLVSKRIKKGSRIVAYINVNKNPFSQLNYGTGKDVSKETIKDANVPLVIKWYGQSYIILPFKE